MHDNKQNPEENMAEKVQEPEVEIEEDVTTEMEEIREAVEAIARQDSIEEGTAEFQELSKNIDSLNSVLDLIEQKSDSINAQLRQILAENRKDRTELSEQQKS